VQLELYKIVKLRPQVTATRERSKEAAAAWQVSALKETVNAVLGMYKVVATE